MASIVPSGVISILLEMEIVCLWEHFNVNLSIYYKNILELLLLYLLIRNETHQFEIGLDYFCLFVECLC
jgi:hypothetical protein